MSATVQIYIHLFARTCVYSVCVLAVWWDLWGEFLRGGRGDETDDKQRPHENKTENIPTLQSFGFASRFASRESSSCRASTVNYQWVWGRRWEWKNNESRRNAAAPPRSSSCCNCFIALFRVSLRYPIFPPPNRIEWTAYVYLMYVCGQELECGRKKSPEFRLV